MRSRRFIDAYRLEDVSDTSSIVITISVSCRPDLAFSQRKLYIKVTNTQFFSFSEADLLNYKLTTRRFVMAGLLRSSTGYTLDLQLARGSAPDQTCFFNKLHENFLFWMISFVAVQNVGSAARGVIKNQIENLIRKNLSSELRIESCDSRGYDFGLDKKPGQVWE
jgi:hypothetical protein